ncbi:hypothetical protein [Tahibacter soli]|uniref:Uncharacterized protein n=1 Tax=Tahibacter soli TaxID=2983605 RepID=A0A9X3YLA1_9GAMM|nr:hypothetical protein [Tahibacter soli]MDC8012788.1 hypothetical protein [Tahibacter soli]
MILLKASFCLLLALHTGASLAADYDCRDVLSITGREHRVIASRDQGLRYRKWTQSRYDSQSWEFLYTKEQSKGQFGFSDDEGYFSSSESLSTWEKQYFEDSQTVFAPAVAAWRECMNASVVRAVTRLNKNNELSIDYYAGSEAGQQPFYGITSLGATCKHGDQVIPEKLDPPEILKNRAWNVTCTRNANTPGNKEVIVQARTGARTVVLLMPKVSLGVVKFMDKPGEKRLLAKVPGCTSAIVIPAEDWDREIQLSMNMRAEGASINQPEFYGYLGTNLLDPIVSFNGPFPVHQGEATLPPNPISATKLWPAYVPVPVLVRGTGGCVSIGAEVSDSLIQNRGGETPHTL